MKEKLSDSIIRALFELIFVALGSFGMQKTRGILRQIIFKLGGFKPILRKLLLCFILFMMRLATYHGFMNFANENKSSLLLPYP